MRTRAVASLSAKLGDLAYLGPPSSPVLSALDAEIKDIDRQLTRLVTATAPKLVARRGIGIHSTATLLVTAGDNPERLRSEGAFARLTGTAPIPASSGQINRFRLSRGGDRQANAALHLVAVNRLANGDRRSKAYVKKRTGGTKANLDILRRLKRYSAREVYPLLVEALSQNEPELTAAA